jgi:hypothetical protein
MTREVKMEFKEDLDHIVKKYQPAVKTAGEQMTKAIREAEDEIARMYKVAHAQVEIQMTNIKKEKLYHAIGKEAAGMMLRGELEIPAFSKHLESLRAMDKTFHKKKNAIIAVGRTKRRKKSSEKPS